MLFYLWPVDGAGEPAGLSHWGSQRLPSPVMAHPGGAHREAAEEVTALASGYIWWNLNPFLSLLFQRYLDVYPKCYWCWCILIYCIFVMCSGSPQPTFTQGRSSNQSPSEVPWMSLMTVKLSTTACLTAPPWGPLVQVHLFCFQSVCGLLVFIGVSMISYRHTDQPHSQPNK